MMLSTTRSALRLPGSKGHALLNSTKNNGLGSAFTPVRHLASSSSPISSSKNDATTATTAAATTTAATPRKRERVVILGSGWAGFTFARSLDGARYERVLVSPRSYFVFTPLLASTAVGTLEFRAAAEPVRRIRGLDAFHQGWADDVDFARRVVWVEANAGDRATAALPAAVNNAPTTTMKTGTPTPTPTTAAKPKGSVFAVPYDRLVVAVGAYSQTFGVPGVRAHAHLLRDVSDARRIRLRVLRRFEQASLPTTSDAQRAALLHFAVVGGGPTGVEFAAELHDLVHEDLLRLYPALARWVKVTVYDVADKILPMFDRQLAAYATEHFAREGIEVKTGHHLEGIREVDEEGGDLRTLRLRIREYGDDEVAAGIVVWSTGLMQNPLVERMVGKEFVLSVEMGDGPQQHQQMVRLLEDPKSGGILTDSRLRVKVRPSSGASAEGTSTPAVLPNVYAIGDCAVIEGQPLPATAQVAGQKAAYLARRLNRGGVDDDGRPFGFRNWGTMAYLGGWKAIHQSSADELKGWSAWVLWRTAYLTYSVSLRNKIMVPFYWFMTWVFGRDISRF